MSTNRTTTPQPTSISRDDRATLDAIVRDSPITGGSTSQMAWATLLSAIILGGDASASRHYPALTLASQATNTILVKALLALGAQPNVIDSDGRTAIMIAASNDDLPTAEVLLNAGANPNVPQSGGTTALHIAAERSPEMVSMLIAHGADPNAKDALGKTPLDCARSSRKQHNALLLQKALDVPSRRMIDH